ncbi:putative cation transport regulator ChaB [Salinicola sp. DM10]|uniref:putative cation transport regulator ChaB n=1 Tax=Salinicola sp. DM10 TaxID=2815721 RepID=UPI001A8CD5FD|nr:putative cation transport regulator ChaB [Salinicola sp. DM10]MCE3027744.1 putative cation transport regulator ChaB [Salinicola sp. DM10]
MPYDSRDDIPESARKVLPPHARTIYQEAFNSAWEQYKKPEDRRGDSSREEVAHAVAWKAVEAKYAKGDDGKWHPKD